MGWKPMPRVTRAPPDEWRTRSGVVARGSGSQSAARDARMPLFSATGTLMTTTATTATATPTSTGQLNRYSSRITQPASQGASQAMLIATGLSWADLNKPQVGIGAVWYEGNPCNMHLADLGNHVKKGCEQAGMVGMRFNTVGVSDGISMGTDGMSFSLQSRDLIADSIETIMGAQW